ncbi:hypothetical protein [Aureispira anguillae]|uniref:Helix-hairpin-helix domain-containing protein n=1 Tax=Aureispira anguillae TaxID=2864201 RepID=A0A916DVG4_9BACT|nr:hypothetical protein [Aureispira anguillae]BDS14331.1 hypothetical protein AsAng_0051100 [Aureispira anguillae]
MLKKLRKTLNKEFKKRYEKMESHYLGLENRIYTTIEERLSTLEVKFEELSELIKDEVRYRKERNEDKIEEREFDHYDAEEETTLFSEKVEDVKDVIEAKIKEAKETVNEKVEEVAKQVDKAKKIVTEKLKKGKKVKEEATSQIKEVVENIEESVGAIEDDLTTLKGLGEKMAEKLAAEGITTYQQLAKMTEKQADELDEKIKSFAARFKRYDWKQQAKDQ